MGSDFLSVFSSLELTGRLAPRGNQNEKQIRCNPQGEPKGHGGEVVCNDLLGGRGKANSANTPSVDRMDTTHDRGNIGARWMN